MLVEGQFVIQMRVSVCVCFFQGAHTGSSFPASNVELHSVQHQNHLDAAEMMPLLQQTMDWDQGKYTKMYRKS